MPVNYNDFYRSILVSSYVDIISGEDVVISNMLIKAGNISMRVDSVSMLEIEIEGRCEQGSIVYSNNVTMANASSGSIFTSNDTFIRINGELFPIRVHDMRISMPSISIYENLRGDRLFEPDQRGCEVNMCLSYRENSNEYNVSTIEGCERFCNLDIEEEKEEENYGRFDIIDLD